MTFKWPAIAALAAFACGPASAAPGLVLGDSIGVGMSLASGVKRLAHNSVTIGREDILGQIAEVPAGTVAFISLGTNDAVGSIKGVSARVDKVIAAVEAAGVTAVWIGPACVIQPWNTTVSELDAALSKKLSGHMPYVSIADEGFCDAAIRGKDGVHFKMPGYRRIWTLARAAAGVQIDAGGAVAEPVKAVKKSKMHRKKSRKHKKKTVPAAAPPVELPGKA